ncbi:hypothetical protein [Streptomyces tubercidicus]|uniref:hypothetical protein n=1 Tax=Streptomyces tubercidicus TaxID=47759 RepID=UPI0036CC4EE4
MRGERGVERAAAVGHACVQGSGPQLLGLFGRQPELGQGLSGRRGGIVLQDHRPGGGLGEPRLLCGSDHPAGDDTQGGALRVVAAEGLFAVVICDVGDPAAAVRYATRARQLLQVPMDTKRQ